MKNQLAYEAIQASVNALHQAVGPRYQTCYLYGSLAQGLYQPDQSDINLLIIVDDETDIHTVRAALHPVWANYGEILRHAPGIATTATFRRHMLLNPILARHIDRFGKQVKGSQKVLYQTSPLDKVRYVARLSAQAWQASEALAPQLLATTEAQTEALANLRRLVRQVRRRPVAQEERAEALFLEVQTALEQQISLLGLAQALPRDPLITEKQVGDMPYHLPGLRAIYERMGKLILVADDLASLANFAWDKLADEVSGSYIGLQVTTPVQFQLAVEYEYPLEYVLRNFRHVWGEQFIEKLSPPTWAVLRDAARFATNIQIYELPHAYITANAQQDEEAALRKLIHDFQNKLLNARLQNELLSRMKLTDRFEPPQPLPDRNRPTSDRVSGIFDQLQAWSKFYEEGMLRAV
jgi:hypothetical protein